MGKYVKKVGLQHPLYSWPHAYNLNKLGRGSLGDASYQISKLLALWFQRRRFFKFSSRKSIFSLLDLNMQRP